jgi:hypothetical protein
MVNEMTKYVNKLQHRTAKLQAVLYEQYGEHNRNLRCNPDKRKEIKLR